MIVFVCGTLDHIDTTHNIGDYCGTTPRFIVERAAPAR